MLKENLSPDPEKPMVGQVVKFFEDCWEYSHRKKLENDSAEEEIVMRSVTEIGMESVDISDDDDDENDSQEAKTEHDSPFPGIPLHTEGSPVLGRRYSDSRSSVENLSKTGNDSRRNDDRETDKGRAAEVTQTFEKGLQDLMESCLSAQRDRVGNTFLVFLLITRKDGLLPTHLNVSCIVFPYNYTDLGRPERDKEVLPNNSWPTR